MARLLEGGVCPNIADAGRLSILSGDPVIIESALGFMRGPAHMTRLPRHGAGALAGGDCAGDLRVLKRFRERIPLATRAAPKELLYGILR